MLVTPSPNALQLVEPLSHATGGGSDLREEPRSTNGPETAVVRLLRSSRVPAGHVQIVEAELLGSCHTDRLAMLEPTETFCCSDGAEVEPDGVVTLLVSNRGRSPLQLSEGQVVGKTVAVSLGRTKQKR